MAARLPAVVDRRAGWSGSCSVKRPMASVHCPPRPIMVNATGRSLILDVGNRPATAWRLAAYFGVAALRYPPV